MTSCMVRKMNKKCILSVVVRTPSDTPAQHRALAWSINVSFSVFASSSKTEKVCIGVFRNSIFHCAAIARRFS